VLTDRELDARLAGAAGVRDGDLPPLPLDLATLIGQPAPAAEPASVIAARQLVDDARASRVTARSRRRPRRAVLRVGAAAVAVAAVWAAVVLPQDPAVPEDGGTAAPTSTAPTTAPPTLALPTGGISLVAAEAVTFPLSLDPVPPGLTPVVLSRSGGVEEQGFGPLTWSADYEQLDGQPLGGVGIQVLPEDPRLGGRGWPDQPDRHDIVDSGVVTVDGQDAAYVQAAYREPGPGQGDLTTALTWQRPDGQWIEVLGSGGYGDDPAALIAVARSIVFRPQPVDLQFGLAPAGWSVTGYQTGGPSLGAYLDVTSDRDPRQLIRLGLIGRQGGATIDSAIEDIAPAAAAEPVTVHGLDARLARVPANDGQPEHWVLVGEFVADGPLLQLLAPVELTPEQVVAIADQTSYTP
jgi:hypothetical protein